MHTGAAPRPTDRLATRAASQSNGLLAGFSPSVGERLRGCAERVHFAAGTVLCESSAGSDFVYFPVIGMVSLIAMTCDGHSIEIATVSRDGVVGLPPPFGPRRATYDAVAQFRGAAFRLPAHALLAETQRDQAVLKSLLRYTQHLFASAAQAAVCHRFHSVQQRLARWLLHAADAIMSDTVLMTQERLAGILGAARTSLTLAALALQDAGLIHSRHGKIRIVNRSGLQNTACECYELIRIDQANTLTT